MNEIRGCVMGVKRGLVEEKAEIDRCLLVWDMMEVVRLCHGCYMKALPAVRWLVQDGAVVSCERCGGVEHVVMVGLPCGG